MSARPLLRPIRPTLEQEKKLHAKREEVDNLRRLAVRLLARPEWDAFRRLADDVASPVKRRMLKGSVQGRESDIIRDLGWLACFEEIINLPLRIEADLDKEHKDEVQATGQAE